MIWIWISRGNLKREMESQLIAAENNTMSKPDLMIRRKMASVGYVVTEKKSANLMSERSNFVSK